MNRTFSSWIYALAFASGLAYAQGSPAIRANAEGNQAYFAGKFMLAIDKFDQALRSATETDDKQYQAISMYGLARANAQLCKLIEAERWFRESIALREKLPDDKYARATQNYLEFARYLMAHDRAAEALPYMDRSIPNLEALKIDETDPIAYVEFLDSYAGALQDNNRREDATNVRSRAQALRAKYPDKAARFKPEKYPSAC